MRAYQYYQDMVKRAEQMHTKLRYVGIFCFECPKCHEVKSVTSLPDTQWNDKSNGTVVAYNSSQKFRAILKELDLLCKCAEEKRLDDYLKSIGAKKERREQRRKQQGEEK